MTCQLVIGDLPLQGELADSGPPDEPDRADAIAETGSSDVAPESEGDSADAGAEDADSGDADIPDREEVDAEPCTGDVTWYADADGDGYGRTDEVRVICPKPPGRWARNSGDCNDGNAFVYPGQTRYFGTPFAVPGGGVSFDYNCANGEEGDPLQQKAPPNCGLLSLALCDAVGYAITPRTGLGLNPYCGSTVSTTCRAALAILICEGVSEEVEAPYRCR